MAQHIHDTDNFYETLAGFPDQFWRGLELAKDVRAPRMPTHTLLSGMGGSALPGDILDVYLRGEAVLYMNRDYGVPHWVNDTTLVICVSYSGNTEETIESFHDARDRGAMMVVVTAGGELAALAKQYQVPLVLVPAGLQPRCATGFLFSAIIGVLMNTGIVGTHHAEHIIQMAAEIDAMEFEPEAERIAAVLKDHVPIVYASNRFHAIARVWKIKINENAKTQAFHNVFPELNHNELVGYTNLIMKPYLLFLKSSADHERVRKRMEITRDVLMRKNIPVMDIAMRGSTVITQIFSTLLLGDWVSYYIAREYGIDPTPVHLVEEFKKLMKQ